MPAPWGVSVLGTSSRIKNDLWNKVLAGSRQEGMQSLESPWAKNLVLLWEKGGEKLEQKEKTLLGKVRKEVGSVQHLMASIFFRYLEALFRVVSLFRSHFIWMSAFSLDQCFEQDRLLRTHCHTSWNPDCEFWVLKLRCLRGGGQSASLREFIKRLREAVF